MFEFCQQRRHVGPLTCGRSSGNRARTPVSPAIILFHVTSLPIPSGVTRPMPVTTTRRNGRVPVESARTAPFIGAGPGLSVKTSMHVTILHVRVIKIRFPVCYLLGPHRGALHLQSEPSTSIQQSYCHSVLRCQCRCVILGKQNTLHAGESLSLHRRIRVHHQSHDQLLAAQFRHQPATCIG